MRPYCCRGTGIFFFLGLYGFVTDYKTCSALIIKHALSPFVTRLLVFIKIRRRIFIFAVTLALNLCLSNSGESMPSYSSLIMLKTTPNFLLQSQPSHIFSDSTDIAS